MLVNKKRIYSYKQKTNITGENMSKHKEKKTISIAIGYILNILLFLVFCLIIIGIYYIVQIKVFQNDYANLFGYPFLEVATGSMAGTREIGDVVIVKITKDVNQGEVIVYKEGDNFITHRLVEKDDNHLVAKGDANNSEDKPITEDQILGRVIYIIPKLGVWRKIFLSPEIIGLIVLLLFLLGAVVQFVSKNDKTNKEDET